MTEIQWIIWLDTHVAWSSFLQELMTINSSLLINLWVMLLAGVTSTVLVENQYSSSFQCSAWCVPKWVSASCKHCHLCFTSSSNWWITNFSANTMCWRKFQLHQDITPTGNMMISAEKSLPLKDHPYFIYLFHHLQVKCDWNMDLIVLNRLWFLRCDLLV